MNRRDFLTALLGTAAATAVIAKLEPLKASSVAVQPSEAERWGATYSAAHDEAWRIFRAEMTKRGFERPSVETPNLRLGDTFADGKPVVRQLNVAASSGLDCEGTLLPAMAALADRAAATGIDRFTSLPLPLHGLEYAGNRGPLRMVVQYSLEYGQPIVVRFDIAGGSSARGERMARRYNQRGLVERLKRYPTPRLNPARLPD